MALKQDIGLPCLNCAKCKGFKIHGWRKICTECQCNVDKHDISEESTMSILDEMKLMDKSYYTSYQESLSLAEKNGKSWLPIGIKLDDINEFCSLFPISLNKTDGDKIRKKRIRLQIPVQDRCVEKFCHLDTTVERQEAEKYLNHRNSRDIGIGQLLRIGEDDETVCTGCNQLIKCSSLAIICEISSNSSTKLYFHPKCVICSFCEEIIVDYIFAHPSVTQPVVDVTNKLFCIRHYAKNLRPRCETCDEIIFSTELVKSSNNDDDMFDYHTNHFACNLCDQSLSRKQYLFWENKPVCMKCYDVKMSNKCDKCQLQISCEMKDISYSDRHWHQECFVCCICNVNLEQLEFGTGVSDNKLYCESCHMDKHSQKCVACNRSIDYGKKLVNFKQTSWHYECFICCDCSNPIGSESFTMLDNSTTGSSSDGDKRVCVTCFEKNYCKTCDRCQLPIKQGRGARVKDLYFHDSCLLCNNCNAEIKSDGFEIVDKKLTCNNCIAQRKGEICRKCKYLITANNNTKYFQRDESMWHSACFICDRCWCSLKDREFIAKADRTLCSACDSNPTN